MASGGSFLVQMTGTMTLQGLYRLRPLVASLRTIGILCILVETSLLSMSTDWMATAYEKLTSTYPEYRNRWISDEKWIEIIRNNYIVNPSKEKEVELKFNRGNMVRAIGSRWKTTIEDFT
jgi:hypothetical protein